MIDINIKEAQENILNSMITVVKTMQEKLKFNRTEYGKITKVIGNGKYGVTINEIESEIYALDSKSFSVGDIVIVIVCNNSFNTSKYILAKRPKES